jgi:S-DNA-T family DNA segregation ATPase FtsK/SpoIIIE
MSHVLTVTEVRNALRCPRVFALGRLRGQQVAFPMGASSLGAAFHRIVESFARTIHDPPESLRMLEADVPAPEVAQAILSWLVELLSREIEINPTYMSMPAEIDDLAEALRHFAAYIAERSAAPKTKPSEAVAKFLENAEVPAEATVELGDEPLLLSGRIDALHAPPSGAVEVVEYKLTDEANDEIDRAQVALYRHLLGRTRAIDATPVILRFNPHLTTTRLTPEAADTLVQKRLLPLLSEMVAWADRPDAAPATRRTDLCAACPVRRPCAEVYPQPLSSRDDPPSGALRPRPEPTGDLLPSAPDAGSPVPIPLRLADETGVIDGEAMKERILAILKRQGVAAAAPKPPVVGPRLIRVEVIAPRGRVKAIDRAAEDVLHGLHAEDGVIAEYLKDGGLRIFCVARRQPRTVALRPLLDAKADWLAQRAGRFVLGEGLDGSAVSGDLSEPTSCHLLIGGTTGSGKSVLLRSIAASLAHFHPPSSIRFTLVDPKRVSFAKLVSGLAAHLATPLCYDVEEALPVLEDLVGDMEERYRLFQDERVQDIDEFNESRSEGDRLARHVVLVDEFQDLLVAKDTKETFVAVIRRLGAKARAAGIHLILATQRPTKDNVPTSIKANLPGRIALKAASQVESRVIIDRGGAESLLGYGDLLADLGRGLIRTQAPLN